LAIAGAKMAVPLLTQKIVKKRVKQFKRPHLDRYKCLKVALLILLRVLKMNPAVLVADRISPNLDC
jgi:large subunit ribosomal protein L32e